MADQDMNEKRAAERQLLKAEVTFHTEDDIYMASSVDISEKGIRIVTDNPIDVRIQINEDDKLVQYDAQLVWARVKEDGTMEYGLKY
jgi:PilZ domain